MLLSIAKNNSVPTAKPKPTNSNNQFQHAKECFDYKATHGGYSEGPGEWR